MPGIDSDSEMQLNQIEEALKKLTPEKKPIDPESHIREILGTRTEEAASKAQTDVLVLISRFGKTLTNLRENGVEPGVFNLPLKEAGYRSNWGLKLLTENNGDGIRQVVSMSEDKGGDMPRYTRYAQMNVNEFLALNKSDLTESTRAKILSLATMDGSILVRLGEDDLPKPPYGDVTNTFVMEIAHKAYYDARDMVDHQAGDKYKKYTDENLLRADLSNVANVCSAPLEEFIPTALDHLQHATSNKNA